MFVFIFSEYHPFSQKLREGVLSVYPQTVGPLGMQHPGSQVQCPFSSSGANCTGQGALPGTVGTNPN